MFGKWRKEQNPFSSTSPASAFGPFRLSIFPGKLPIASLRWHARTLSAGRNLTPFTSNVSLRCANFAGSDEHTNRTVFVARCQRSLRKIAIMVCRGEHMCRTGCARKRASRTGKLDALSPRGENFSYLGLITDFVRDQGLLWSSL